MGCGLRGPKEVWFYRGMPTRCSNRHPARRWFRSSAHPCPFPSTSQELNRVDGAGSHGVAGRAHWRVPSHALRQINVSRTGKKELEAMKLRGIVLSAFLLGLWVTEARADAGLPMIIVSMTGLIVTIVPIILVEAFVLSRGLGSPWQASIIASTAANLASMFVGIPAAWFLMVLLEMSTGGGGAHFVTALDKVLSVTRDAAWISPYQDWQIPVAQLVLLVPFFFASYWVETSVLVRIWPTETARVRTVSMRANLVTYTMLAAITLGALVWTLAPASSKQEPLDPKETGAGLDAPPRTVRVSRNEPVSEQELEALEAKYGKDLAALPRVLSEVVARAREVSPSWFDESSAKSKYSFDALSIASAKDMLDCSKFESLVVRAEQADALPTVEGDDVAICSGGVRWLGWFGADKPWETDYGPLYVRTTGNPLVTYYRFQLMREDQGVRYVLDAILVKP